MIEGIEVASAGSAAVHGSLNETVESLNGSLDKINIKGSEKFTKKKENIAKVSASSAGSGKGDKETKLGVDAKKSQDFSAWYTQVLLRSEMMDYYDVSGCYILRPWSFAIWKQVQSFLGSRFEALGVEDAYFPLFIAQSALQKEKDHVEGFAPEVAWVTRAGNTDLPDPIAVRPTSETVMYPAYSRWIQSHRDLPLRMNQWCNVVRWEFKHPQPFLRSREFLWQEGHTCFMSKAEADEEVLQILELYRRCYEEVLAVPVIKGRKSENEKFAGALYTTTVEGFIPAVGRGIQGATSHCLGQNFSKMFNIGVESTTVPGEVEYVWQNSWGFTTRSIGVTVMVHSDDNGLVLPPRVASVQVVIVPVGITARLTPQVKEEIYTKCQDLVATLCAAGIRAKVDLRDNYTPGWKFNHWELKGVPVRYELGPLDLASNETRAALRWSGEKRQISLVDIASSTAALLDEIHDGMFAKAKAERDAGIRRVNDWDSFTPALDDKCLVLIPWCQVGACEDAIKERSGRRAPVDNSGIEGNGDSLDGGAVDVRAPAMGAKSLCIPFDQPEPINGHTCVQCGAPAKCFGLFGRSY